MIGDFKTWLDARPTRERYLLVSASWLLALIFVWWLAIKPALYTYRASAAAHAKLDAELAQMKAMAQQAEQLKALPIQSKAAALVWLQTTAKKLSKARVSVQGGRAEMSFAGVTPEVLTALLVDARKSAQLLPTEASWTRGSAEALWEGTIFFVLPSK